MYAYKRQRISALIIAVIITVMVFFAFNCKVSDADDRLYGVGNVVFFDVGDGDATFLNFPDGKNMLIDCGTYDEKIYSNISEFLKKNVKKIDYFVLTHPDLTHIGNAKNIIEDFIVENIYMFTGFETGYLTFLDEFKETAKNKGIKINVSELGVKIFGDNYFTAFLSPMSYSSMYSSYHTVKLYPDEMQNVKNVSPIIYYECVGVRFILTGDAGKSEEKRVIENYFSGIYDLYYGDRVDIKNVDFLKVADHGSENASFYEFIANVSPDNAIISCGGRKAPDKSTLLNLTTSNPNSEIFRTDSQGTITVSILSNGMYSIKTELF